MRLHNTTQWDKVLSHRCQDICVSSKCLLVDIALPRNQRLKKLRRSFSSPSQGLGAHWNHVGNQKAVRTGSSRGRCDAVGLRCIQGMGIFTASPGDSKMQSTWRATAPVLKRVVQVFLISPYFRDGPKTLSGIRSPLAIWGGS